MKCLIIKKITKNYSCKKIIPALQNSSNLLLQYFNPLFVLKHFRFFPVLVSTSVFHSFYLSNALSLVLSWSNIHRTRTFELSSIWTPPLPIPFFTVDKTSLIILAGFWFREIYFFIPRPSSGEIVLSFIRPSCISHIQSFSIWLGLFERTSFS